MGVRDGAQMPENEVTDAQRNELTYAQRMSAVNTLISRLERCDDVDVALRVYDEAVSHLDACETRVAAAQGKFEELMKGA